MGVDIRVGEFNTNITYNLSKMFTTAFNTGEYWLDELEGRKGFEVIELLTNAIIRMVKDPDHFKQFDAPNGWGTFNDALPWLIQLKEECVKNPNDEIELFK